MTGHDDVGSLADEAARLIGALQDWAHRMSADAPIATGAPECQWCPVCQLISMLRGERPDLAEKAGDTVRTVVSALVTAFTTPHPHASDPGPPGDAGEARPSGRRVERIDLSGEETT